MEKNAFIRLAEKIAQGEASDTEIALYKRYCSYFEKKAPYWYTELGEEAAVGEALKRKIDRALFEHKEKATRRLHPAISVAASIVLVLGIGFLAWKGYRMLQADRSEMERMISADIAPGGDRATLTLADGSTLALTDTINEVIHQGGMAIHQRNGQLVYAVVGQAIEDHYNTLSTPRGGQYQVTLPDGTQVWLNAASTLKYPTHFGGQSQRRVELDGEAYFEVAKDETRPFIVSSNQQTIQVLGTHFNVHAYKEESFTRTTLLEGAIKVTGKMGQQMLKPGQQTILSDSEININNVAVEDAVAWKNGYFMFNSESLESIMSRVARWYDVEVTYQDSSLKDRTFFGSISRYENISKVLEMLEATDVATFKLNENKLIVYRK